MTSPIRNFFLFFFLFPIFSCFAGPFSAVQLNKMFSSVVYISNFEKTSKSSEDPSISYGSGFFWDEDGTIVTNAHVIQNARRLEVTTYPSRTSYSARVIAQDESSDIAIIKIDNLKTVPFPRSPQISLDLLEQAWTIGHPYNFDFTISEFRVASLRRYAPDDSTYLPFIQLQGHSHPGNSGGPLINQNGMLVGMLSQSYSDNQGHSLGLSFSISFSDLSFMVNHLLAKKQFNHGRLGVSTQPLTSELKRYFKIPLDAQGILVSYIDPRICPQSGSSFLPGDVLLSFSHTSLETPNDFLYVVSSSLAGSSYFIERIRNSEYQTQNLTVCSEYPRPSPFKPLTPPLQSSIFSPSGFDIEVQSPVTLSNPNLHFRPPYTYGVSIVTPPSKQLQIQTGDIILSVDRQPFSNLDEFSKLLKNGQPHLLLIQSGSQPPFFYLLNPHP